MIPIKVFVSRLITLELCLNPSLLFKMMKKKDITLGDVEALPYQAIGDHLIKFRRKKRSSKKSAANTLYSSFSSYRQQSQLCSSNADEGSVDIYPDCLPNFQETTQKHFDSLLTTPNVAFATPRDSQFGELKNESLFFGQGFMPLRAESSVLHSPCIPELTPYTKMLSKSSIGLNDFTAFQGIFLFHSTIDLQMSPSFMWNTVRSPKLPLMSPSPDLSKEQREGTEGVINFISTLNNEQPIIIGNDNTIVSTSETNSSRKRLNITALNFGSIKN